MRPLHYLKETGFAAFALKMMVIPWPLQSGLQPLQLNEGCTAAGGAVRAHANADTNRELSG